MPLNWSNKTQYELHDLNYKMQTREEFPETIPEEISKLLKEHYFSLMVSFCETQSSFLTGIYKRYKSIETANIIICFTRNMHLSIIRQREKNLNHNVSLENFWHNLHSVQKTSEKIASIVQITAIPKETVRRKIKKLLDIGFLINEKNTKRYAWNPSSKHKDFYQKIINEEIKILSKFTYKLTCQLKLNLDIKLIEKEIKSQFSFYWYHFLSCELQWLKMWQSRLRDNDLLLIILQAVIPTLHYAEKYGKDVNLNKTFKTIGEISDKYNFSETAISAAAVSDVTGISRATCFRKLEKLVLLGFLFRETKTKRYYINQNVTDGAKNIITKENVSLTIEIFSKYLSIILNSLMHNQK